MSVTSLLLMQKLEKTNKVFERKTPFYRKVEIHPVGRYGLIYTSDISEVKK